MWRDVCQNRLVPDIAVPPLATVWLRRDED
jgi:hypothetical protein